MCSGSDVGLGVRELRMVGTEMYENVSDSVFRTSRAQAAPCYWNTSVLQPCVSAVIDLTRPLVKRDPADSSAPHIPPGQLFRGVIAFLNHCFLARLLLRARVCVFADLSI